MHNRAAEAVARVVKLPKLTVQLSIQHSGLEQDTDSVYMQSIFGLSTSSVSK